VSKHDADLKDKDASVPGKCTRSSMLYTIHFLIQVNFFAIYIDFLYFQFF
jgi:hypothetical protein